MLGRLQLPVFEVVSQVIPGSDSRFTLPFPRPSASQPSVAPSSGSAEALVGPIQEPAAKAKTNPSRTKRCPSDRSAFRISIPFLARLDGSDSPSFLRDRNERRQGIYSRKCWRFVRNVREADVGGITCKFSPRSRFLGANWTPGGRGP